MQTKKKEKKEKNNKPQNRQNRKDWGNQPHQKVRLNTAQQSPALLLKMHFLIPLVIPTIIPALSSLILILILLILPLILLFDPVFALLPFLCYLHCARSTNGIANTQKHLSGSSGLFLLDRFVLRFPARWQTGEDSVESFCWDSFVGHFDSIDGLVVFIRGDAKWGEWSE